MLAYVHARDREGENFRFAVWYSMGINLSNAISLDACNTVFLTPNFTRQCIRKFWLRVSSLLCRFME